MRSALLFLLLLAAFLLPITMDALNTNTDSGFHPRYVNDLAAISLTGTANPRFGAQTLYTLTIHNPGTQPQYSYQVKLFRGAGIEEFSWNGPTIQPGATTTMTLPWIPAEVGPEALYGKISLSTDQDSSNDQTPSLNVDVQAVARVGNGNQQALIPVNMYYRTSLFETIYFTAEMNCMGLITDICFYNNFVTQLFDIDTVIWLGETTLNDLTGGWIPASQLTQVFSGDVDYPSGQNEIVIHLDTPYQYGGGNLVLLVHRPWDEDYYSSQDLFFCQTIGSNRSLTTFNDNTTINPDNPPITGVTGQFPSTAFFLSNDGIGSLTGVVRTGGLPLSGATVSIANTSLSTTTFQGSYGFPYLPAGTYQLTATAPGYNSQTQTVTVVQHESFNLDFSIDQLAMVTVSGRVVGSNNPALGLYNASVTLTGYAPYEATTNVNGDFSIPGVYAGNTYTYSIAAPGYQNANGTINVGTGNYIMGDIMLAEIAYAPQNVVARESDDGNSVDISWDAPITAQEGWIHYDSGENFNSFGTAGSLSFDVAIRFPASALSEFVGGSLQAVKIWPAMGGNFAVRVWLGGSGTAPGTMVLHQPIIPVLNSYNTILLDTPIPITGTEELWFGFLCDVTGVNPAYAGVDAGPAVNGFSNMIYWQGNWTTLLAVNSYCDFNWNIQGYVGMTPPSEAPELMPLTTVKSKQPLQKDPGAEPQRIVAYKVWRFLQGQANNEASWTNLTPNPITDTDFEDSNWNALPDGIYYWAVKAIYLNGITSEPAFSNPLNKVSQVGTIAGIVRNQQNAPLSGALVSCGEVTATTNASGAYTMLVPSGTHSVTASHVNYQSNTQTGVIVVTGQTTTLNFVLLPAVTNLDDGFEDYPDFALSFAPWTCVDVDQSSTYDMPGTTWANSTVAQAFIIFNPSATIPPITTITAHGGTKMAACVAATIPPNNDWLISPPLTAAGRTLRFWARSLNAEYGLERFRVGVSTTGTAPANFTIISGANYIEAPVDWTEYTFNLGTFPGNIYVGIQCVSDDAWILFVDDVRTFYYPATDDPGTPELATRLLGNHPNPFRLSTTLDYSIKESAEVRLGVYNVKGQLVKTMVQDIQSAGLHSVTWDGQDERGNAVSSGVYYIRMQAGNYSSTAKMLLMK